MSIKLHNLFNYIKQFEKICVSFSGGIDSAFLLEAANRALNGNVLAIIAKGSMLPQKEIEFAREFCSKRNIRLLEIEADEFKIEAFINNTQDRCYHCKHGIFSKIIAAAEENGFNIVAEGTNSDDTSDYRPGKIALRELGVKSPLLETGFSKIEIRQCAKEFGIEIWDKPSAACLATRVPTGVKVTPELLKQIELAEDILKNMGFMHVRVRVHGLLARIETSPDKIELLCKGDIRNAVSKSLKELGFRYISIDLDGYKTGNMN